MQRALITGITGQDGSYLADLLLEKGYEVHGIIRRASTFNTARIDHLYVDPHINGVRLFLHYGDLADSVNLVKLVYDLKPDEIYHLAAQSHVRVSFDIPEYTADVTGVGTIGNLEGKRDWGYEPEYVAGMWQMLQRDSGDDFVLATNETHTVREFWEAAFEHVDLDWKEFVKHDPRYERPAEVDILIGNAAKAKKILGWEAKTRFNELVRLMVEADMELLERKTVREHLGDQP